MKKIKSVLRFFCVCGVIAVVFAVISGVIFYETTTHGLELDTAKLRGQAESVSLKVLSQSGKNLSNSNESYIPITKLSADTKNAFICAEDKRFYSHGGVDFIRMAGAMISNLKSRSFSEGASTISQQLIKNTQLSSEKTISRKLKEIKLARELEQNFSKDEILEMYLNNIYFGGGCYGIENASRHYFSKSASELTLSESALLAGTINAPSVYDIENKTDKAISRRNLVLGLMCGYGKITEDEKQNSQNENVDLNLSSVQSNNYVYAKVIDEACEILNMTETQLKNSDITIHTFFDDNLQNEIKNKIEKEYSKLDSSPSVACLVLDNKTGGVVACVGGSKTFESKKQPGSIIKPILVYGSAIENNIVSPATKILDSKINFGGYSPENADKKYHGYVSVRECLKNSYNVPAVKLLNEVGIENAKNFASQLGIEFTENDNNLALALGCLSGGVPIQNLAEAYSCLARGGDYQKSKYISKITQNGKTIYDAHASTNNANLKNTNKNLSIKTSTAKNQAMKPSTAYLLTNILMDTSKTGTAKRLKDFDFELASKTGTVGAEGSTDNLEAFCVSYTSEHTILTYVGGTVMPSKINGATYPTMLAKDTLNLLYSKTKPQDFKIPTDVKTVKISKSEYEKNIVSASDENENTLTEIFSKSNLPQKTESSLILTLEAFNFEGKKPILSFYTNSNYSCKLCRKSANGSFEILKNFDETSESNYEIENKSSEEIKLPNEQNYENFDNSDVDLQTTKNAKIVHFKDNLAQKDQIYEYFVEFTEKSTAKTYKTNKVKLKAF